MVQFSPFEFVNRKLMPENCRCRSCAPAEYEAAMSKLTLSTEDKKFLAAVGIKIES